MKQVWPAPERNKMPILEVLARVLRARGTLLELSSGSGQHAAFFAEQLPGLTVLPSDCDDENLTSIRAWVAESGLSNLHEPLRIDVREADWGVGKVAAIFNANMIHIAPWECALGLLRGAAHHLESSGLLVLYGPYRIGGAHTSASNESFDAGLRARDPAWGVRNLEDVASEAESVGLELVERVAMPANNQTLIFRRC